MLYVGVSGVKCIPRYHYFDRIVIFGYLPLLSRAEHIVYFFRDVHGVVQVLPML